MKKKITLIINIFLISCGSGINTGEGAYTGKLVDVVWRGLFWKSCEIRQQTGTGTEHDDSCSSFDKNICDKLHSLMGETITIKYKEQSFSGISIDTNCLIDSIKE